MGKVKARKAAAELEALQQNLPAEEEPSRTQIKRAMEAPVSYTHSPSPRDQRGTRMPSSA